MVLDRRTDRSAQIAAAHRWVETVLTDHGRVGAARATGVTHALSAFPQRIERTWIACTDGDSAVPGDWMQTHLMAAAEGTDLLLVPCCRTR